MGKSQQNILHDMSLGFKKGLRTEEGVFVLKLYLISMPIRQEGFHLLRRLC